MYRAARLLENTTGRDVLELRRAYRGLLAEMERGRMELGNLAPATDHFRKVTRSYWPGLFRCYQTPELPRTNNNLEQCFGSARYHERRATGRRGASPALVVRGQVRLVAAVATRTQLLSRDELRLTDVEQWRQLRRTLDERQEARRVQLRFRRDPEGYLEQLEAQLLKLSLPA